MCGRTVCTLSKRRVARIASVQETEVPDLTATHSFNLCPTNGLITVVETANMKRRVYKMKWGIEPRFTTSHNLSTINARIEGVRTSKLYSPLIDSKRCVVVVDAFYEWDQRTKTHTPYLIRYRNEVHECPIVSSMGEAVVPSDSQSGTSESDEFLPRNVSPLLMAAIYDENPKTGELSCSVLTMDSCDPVSMIHTRMPVLLSSKTAQLWLGKSPFDEILPSIFQSSKHEASLLFCTQVSNLVNSISNKSRDVTLPVSEQKKRSFEKGLGRFFQVRQTNKEEPVEKKFKSE
jgi:putative SOS response-associated peptidase YedK